MREAGSLNQSVFIGLLLLSVLVVSAGSLLLLNPLRGPSPEPPTIDFDEEHERDQVRVSFVSQGVRWDEVQVEISTEGGFVVEGGEMIRTHALVFTPVGVDQEIEAGDMLRVCRSAPGDPGEEVSVALRHSPSGKFLGSWALQDVNTCGSLEEAQSDNETADNETADNETGENGTVENGTVENGTVENGTVENRAVENGTPENRADEKEPDEQPPVAETSARTV